MAPRSQDRTLMQVIGRELVDFVDFVRGGIVDPQVRDAMLRDVGLTPPVDGAPLVVGPPPDGIDAVKAWLDASDPSLEETIQAVGDIATLVDELIEVLGSAIEDQTLPVGEIAHAMLELGATNFVRQRWPRLFAVLQGVSTIGDLTSTYGPYNNNPVSFFTSLAALLGYIWQPGKSIEELSGPNAPDGTPEKVVDLIVRLAAVTLAAIDMKKDIEPLRDVLTGWDAPGLGPDSAATPSRADVVSAADDLDLGRARPGRRGPAGRRGVRPSDHRDGARGGRRPRRLPGARRQPGARAEARRSGGPSAFKARADAAVAMLWGIPDGFDVANPLGGDYEFGVGFAARPPATPSIPDAASTKGFPIRLTASTRIDIGEFDLAITFAGDVFEALVRITESALVLDPKDQDGFMASLIGEGPMRLPFGLEFGPSSSRGMVARYVPPREGSSDPVSAPVSGASKSGTPTFEINVPLGKSIGPLTVHEVGFRVTRGPAELPPPQQTKTTLGVATSFSARIGPVYLRVDQLGLEFTLDDGVPPEDRNLRVVDLGFGARFPRGIAVNVETAIVAGGGSIPHDPDQGIYFGILDLAFRGGLTLQAICLVATASPTGPRASRSWRS